ncbi:MAG: hypothetical protein CEE38_09085 [Planctomycetes bacterium B3_Pla]|nr:MAG: hypothetical protein CEE38_09085 [Planctomycetes bacterium B3_Pla]
MNDRNHEDLTRLIKKFFDAEQVESCLEDIQKGEQILRDNPAPEPDSLLVANIKAEIGLRLPARGAAPSRKMAYRLAAAAAAIIVLAGVSARFFNSKVEPVRFQAASLIPTAMWESDNVAADDADLAIFTAEIEQIREEVMSLEADEEISENAVTELEMELIEISSDFWKG